MFIIGGKSTLDIVLFGNLFSYHAFCQKHILKIKLWASFPKSDFWKQNLLQTMFFSFYQTQKLSFTFSKCAFYFPNWTPNRHEVLQENNLGYTMPHHHSFFSILSQRNIYDRTHIPKIIVCFAKCLRSWNLQFPNPHYLCYLLGLSLFFYLTTFSNQLSIPRVGFLEHYTRLGDSMFCRSVES